MQCCSVAINVCVFCSCCSLTWVFSFSFSFSLSVSFVPSFLHLNSSTNQQPPVIGKDPHVHEIEVELENWKRMTKSLHSIQGVRSSSGKYLALDKPLTWNRARAECTSRNMELATITNLEENAEALQVATRTCGHVTSSMAGWDLCAWIGLNDYQIEGTLVWASGSKSEYQNFVNGEPNNLGDEDGMALCWTFDGKWIDFSNDGRLPCMLCEAKVAVVGE